MRHTGREARDLLGDALLQIFYGEGMTCVLNPMTAACQPRGTVEDPMVTPDTDDCRPKCPTIARTERDLIQIRRRRDEYAEILADTLAPPIRHQRERSEMERLDAIIEAHDRKAEDQR